MSTRCFTAASLLIATASAASAQTYWYYGDYGPRAKGYYGTPYDGGPQYGAAVATNTAMGPRLQLRPPGAKPVSLALLGVCVQARIAAV